MSVPGQQKTVRFDNLSVNGVGMARRKVAPYARLRGSTELAEVRSATPRRECFAQASPADRRVHAG